VASLAVARDLPIDSSNRFAILALDFALEEAVYELAVESETEDCDDEEIGSSKMVDVRR